MNSVWHCAIFPGERFQHRSVRSFQIDLIKSHGEKGAFRKLWKCDTPYGNSSVQFPEGKHYQVMLKIRPCNAQSAD